jgi:hypothetical protein
MNVSGIVTGLSVQNRKNLSHAFQDPTDQNHIWPFDFRMWSTGRLESSASKQSELSLSDSASSWTSFTAGMRTCSRLWQKIKHELKSMELRTLWRHREGNIQNLPAHICYFWRYLIENVTPPRRMISDYIRGSSLLNQSRQYSWVYALRMQLHLKNKQIRLERRDCAMPSDAGSCDIFW